MSSVNGLAAKRPPDQPRNVPEIVNRYVQASRIQQTALRSEAMQVEITATVLKSRRQGQLRAIRRISGDGEVAYDILEKSGDEGIRRQVIGRYLTAESQAHDADATELTPVNYKFRLKAIVYQLGRRIQVLQLTPRKKKDGLFKGELWVDDATGMPLRESGKLVKAPHPLLKGLAFTREYQISDGLAVPIHDEVTIDVRFWGRVALTIGFANLEIDDGGGKK